jgi:hypothetical protein
MECGYSFLEIILISFSGRMGRGLVHDEHERHSSPDSNGFRRRQRTSVSPAPHVPVRCVLYKRIAVTVTAVFVAVVDTVAGRLVDKSQATG